MRRLDMLSMPEISLGSDLGYFQFLITAARAAGTSTASGTDNTGL